MNCIALIAKGLKKTKYCLPPINVHVISIKKNVTTNTSLFSCNTKHTNKVTKNEQNKTKTKTKTVTVKLMHI